MNSAHDVAQYIVSKLGTVSAMKLQKLIYYSQCWSLVWDEKPMFKEKVEAWANGPVIREIYELHRGRFEISSWPQGNASNLSKSEKKTIDAVLSLYGKKTAQWLSDLSHKERPWLEARSGLSEGERGDSEITLGAIEEYFSGLSAR
jgi:uncharacterized phage-associated protein